jgi:lipopolysaccharide exporter
LRHWTLLGVCQTVTKPKSSLSVATAKGASWIVGWRLATRILGLANMLILARLLVPGDFGLVAIATSFSQAIDTLGEIGVGDALVREHSLDRTAYDTGFTLSVIRGLLSSLILLLSSIPVADFFGDPRLAHIVMVLALVMLISSLENIGIVDYQRHLAFDKEFILYIIPRVLGIGLGLVAAWYLRSYWALVIGIFVTRSLRAILSYIMHPYRPRLALVACRRILAFSAWAWGLSVAGIARDRIDSFVIGRLLGAAPVGIYTVGWEIGFAASVELVLPLSRALFSTFSILRSRSEGIPDAYFRVMSATMLIALPASIGIALIADPLVRLGLGQRWINAVALIQVFAIVGAFKVMGSISSTLLRVFGLQQVQVKILSVTVLIRLVLLIALIDSLGLIGAALAAGLTSAVDDLALLLLTFRRFGMRAADLPLSNWRCFVATVLMTATVLMVQHYNRAFDGGTHSVVWNLVLDVASGLISYVGGLFSIWFMAGRPRGPEIYIADLLRKALWGLSSRQGRVAISSQSSDGPLV